MNIYNNQFHNNKTILIHTITCENSSIQFIRSEDILLSIDFLKTTNKIIINSKINGRYLTKPPTFSIDIVNIYCIKYNYNIASQKLELRFNDFTNNSLVTKNLNISDFHFTKMITLGMKITFKNDHLGDDYNHFLEKCTSLENFDTIYNILNDKKITKQNLIDNLISVFNKKQLNDIYSKEKMSSITNDIIKKVSFTNKKKTTKQLIIFPENNLQYKVYINNDNIKLGENIGKWYYGNNRLLLYLNKRFIVLYIDNNKITDITGLKWHILDDSENINITSRLSNINTNHNIIVLIITCRSRINKAVDINKTWVNDFKKLGIKTIFVIGGSSKSYLQEDFLYLNCNDYYEGLPEKVINAYEFCYNNLSFDYLYKVDDDVIVLPHKLLFTNIVNKHYIGVPKNIDNNFNRFWHRNKCKNKNLNNIPYPLSKINLSTIYAKGETGYFLSRYAIYLLLKHKNYIVLDLYEDKVIGDVLNKYNIYPYLPDNYTTKLFTKKIIDKNIDINNYTVIVDCSTNIIPIYNIVKKYIW